MSKSIRIEDVYRSHAENLRYMSLYYRIFGMNITQMKWSESLKNAKSFKEPIDVEWGDLKFKEQSFADLLSFNWDYSAGIGLVLGYNNYRALDFDIKDDYDRYDGTTIDDFIDDVLKILKLPLDYQWVVRSGNGYGFHIIFKCDNISATSDLDSISFAPANRYGPPEEYFSRIELRWCDHLVLPPSIHASGHQYNFRNKKLPSVSPSYLGLSEIESLLYKYCGDRLYKKVFYEERELTVTKVEKIVSRHDSYLTPHVHSIDSIEYLREVNNPEGQNTLAVNYLFGNGVDRNTIKAFNLFGLLNSQSSIFNLLNLYAVNAITCTFSDFVKLYDKLDEAQFMRKEIMRIRHNAEKYLNKPDLFFFFDTETTGLPKDYHAPASDVDNWPHIVQLAWVITDGANNIISKKNYIIIPYRFQIPAESTKIHGITDSYAREHGILIDRALYLFERDLQMCKYVVGHNLDFDKNVVSAECYRSDMEVDWSNYCSICTMKKSVDICRIPGFYGYKYPKLNELYYTLFKRNMDNAHDALSDISATIECFWELKKKGVIKLSDYENNDVDELP